MKFHNRKNNGFSLVELLVVLLIISVLAGIATPIYLNQKSRGARAVASAAGNLLSVSLGSALADYTSFGTTNGSITVDNTSQPATITVTLGTGATSPTPFTESLTRGVAATGVTYANTVNWCLDIVNNNQHIIITQDPMETSLTTCSNPTISGLTYSSTNFSFGSNSQTLAPPTSSGGSGAKTYSVISGSLPPGVSLDPNTGIMTGPVASAWNFHVAKLSSYNNNTCVVTTLGGVKCWADSTQLPPPLGNLMYNSTPVDIAGLTSGVSQVSVGNGNICIVTTSGGAKCWGYNAYGQLGNGTVTTSATPVDVTGLTSGVASISAGPYDTCAVTTSGGAKCWGDNGVGSLGNGNTTSSRTPVDVTGLTSGVASISVGASSTCALTTSGGAKCWGYNNIGQLGNSNTTNSSTAVDVTGLTSGVAYLSASGSTGCVVTTSGVAKCWGDNTYGQLGNGTTTNSSTPVSVTGLTSGTASITVSVETTCAVTTSGGAKCWGENSTGAVGDGTTTQRLTPVNVTGLSSGVAAIIPSYHYSCDVTTSGTVQCWGDDTLGQLGDGVVLRSLVPVDVTGLSSGVAQVSVGEYSACELKSGGVKCWGRGTEGELGNGSTINSSTLVDVTGLTSGVASISVGTYISCAVTTSGGAKCWGIGLLGNGSYAQSATPVDVTGLTSGVASISAGYQGACAVTTSGGAKCWGYNAQGKLGNGTTTDSTTPVDVTGLTSGVASISTKNANTCAVTTSGGAKCWGYNVYGQIGNGTTTQSLVPVDVTGLTSGVASISVGEGLFTCALTTSGGAKCWGLNSRDELGNGGGSNSSVPVDVTGLTSGVASLASGNQSACVVTTSGGAKCWGWNGNGTLGNGDSTMAMQASPVNVSGLTSGVSSISSGGLNGCALTTSGGVKCWGNNSLAGQLGLGSVFQYLTPVATPVGSGAQAGFPATITVQVSDASGSTSASITLTNS